MRNEENIIYWCLSGFLLGIVAHNVVMRLPKISQKNDQYFTHKSQYKRYPFNIIVYFSSILP